MPSGPVIRRRGRTIPKQSAVLLYTSGTTAAPKAAVLRHRHLTSYLLGSVEFGAADEHEAVLVSVPPYHIAGVTNLLSNVYAGRRVVYLDAFTAAGWLDGRARRGRHPRHGRADDAGRDHRASRRARPTRASPPCASLAYGGAACRSRCSSARFGSSPESASSTPTASPRPARRSRCSAPTTTAPRCQGDPVARRRLGSVGRLLPGIEVEVRDDDGAAAADGHRRRHLCPRRRRSPASTAARAAVSTATAGSPPATAAGSTRTATSSSRAAPTTPSSAAARTSRRPRSRTSCSSTPAVVEVAVVGSPRRGVGPADRRRCRAARRAHRRTPTSCANGCGAGCAARRRPTLIAFRDALPHTDTGKLLRREVLADLLADHTCQPIGAAKTALSDAFILSAARTPIGRARKGSLTSVDAYQLAEIAVGAAVERSEIPVADLDDLFLAESLQGGGVIGRNIAVRLGMTNVPGVASTGTAPPAPPPSSSRPPPSSPAWQT